MAHGAEAEAGVKVSGRHFEVEEIRLVVDVVGKNGGLSRFQLAKKACELLDWRRANGGLKAREARDLLVEVEGRGLVRLPQKRATGRPAGRATRVARSDAGETRPTMEVSLAEVRPVLLCPVRGRGENELFRELIGRHHYLGFATPFGAQLRYVVRSSGGEVLGCIQYSSAAWRLRDRDQFIGWKQPARQCNLCRVVQQSRFLILPWVRVAHLASHVLALSAARVGKDWEDRYGQRPLLIETLVDGARFAGTCYRAANWIEVGMSSGRGRMDREHARHGAAPKKIFVYPLAQNACAELCREQ